MMAATDTPARADVLADLYALILSWSASEEEQPTPEDESDQAETEVEQPS